ncbi:MAG: purine-nucleoside phosphorylase [Planctomycetota bacterium]
MSLQTQLGEARDCLRKRLGERSPTVGMILGSGLEADRLPLENAVAIPAEEIPHLPRPSVVGHKTVWTAAELNQVGVLIAEGRVHGYEGYPLSQVTFAVRLMAAVGCTGLVVTNAAGGIREDLQPGKLMRITDHLNLMGDSPLTGAHDPAHGERFVDLSRAYDSAWGKRAHEMAEQQGISLAEGIYAACRGPQYETPAEVRMLRGLGADAVGMSTVPEVIVARQEGLRVFGLSLITNRAAGLTAEPLSHAEVLAAGKKAAGHLCRLLAELVTGL